MIVADFVKNDCWYRLTLNGHSGYFQDENDDVCAAVSGIFYALCGYLTNMKSKGLTINSMSPGCGDVQCSFEGEEAMMLTCIGLMQIMLTYPENLSVINRAFNWRMRD